MTDLNQAYQYATAPILGPFTVQDLFMLCYACQDAEAAALDLQAKDPNGPHKWNAEHYQQILVRLHQIIRTKIELK